MMGVKDKERVMMVQFHQSYSYEDSSYQKEWIYFWVQLSWSKQETKRKRHHPEEGIAYQTAEDGGALRLPLSQELDGGEADLLWLGPDEVDYYQGYYAKEAQKGNGIAEGHWKDNSWRSMKSFAQAINMIEIDVTAVS